VSASHGRPRIALLVPRFTLFDPHMRDGFVERMRGAAPRHAAVLRRWFDVLETGVIEHEGEAAEVRDLLARERVDAVVFAPAMAAPPSFGQIALERCPAPVVLWNALTTRTIAVDIGQAEATENSTTVGCTMFANTLLRQGRPAPTVTASLDDEPRLELLRRTVAGAAAAGSLRGASLLRIGAPIAGYRNIEASAGQLAELGLREIDVAADELDDAFGAVDDETAAGVLDELHEAGFVGDGGPQAVRSARLAEAVHVLLDRHDAVLGTVNCHGPLLRFSDRIGITACLAVAREALRGRPLSCTGDGPAAIALLLARRLAGAALYNECYAAEPATGLLLVAAGGEGDPGWADGAVQLEANDHYPGTHGQGSSVAFALRQGPATLLSASPVDVGWRLAWATGEIVETRSTKMRGPNGMLRLDSGDATDAVSRWIASGATHHNALAPGRLDVELEVLCDVLGVRSVRV
jgi:L-arabinose isomerase